MTRVNKSISLDVSTIVKIEKYQKVNGISGFSEAIENIILKGLKKE